MSTTFPKVSLSPQRGNNQRFNTTSTPTSPATSAEVLERASSNAKAEENYCFVQKIKFNAIHDHILPSRCNHQENIQCQVGASAAWSETRKDHIAASGTSKPFDWTYTSDYAGTLGNDIKIEDTDLKIDIEKLKRRDPIFFYTQLTLYEDELADHGCSLMAIKVRVMPETFFVLCRFYLRVDHVMVRVCDTRLYGETNSNFLLREWTLREAKYSDLSPTDLDNVRDSNIIWQSLPIIESKSQKIYIE
uniref:TIP41-like protein n=1 Tax=Panagrolaimus sp. ES5 TaxID=591445 RepID=A0AC34FNS5_9BILA